MFQTVCESAAAIKWRLVVGDAAACPFDDDAFDAVVVRHFLHALPDPQPVLREVRRILKPGGHLFFKEHDVPDSDSALI